MRYVTNKLPLPMLVLLVLGICSSSKAGTPRSSAPPPTPAAKASVSTPGESSTAWLSSYFGKELVKADGSKVAVSTLGGKTIGVYFSAHWCPPCRGFTPVLVKAYNEIVGAGKPFEIVFASSDRDEQAMFGYMKEMSMPWLGLPFSSEAKDALSKKYGVRGIPTLVILDETGDTVTKDGRGDVAAKGASAFDKW